MRTVSWILVIVGALNWGLVGVFKWDLVGGIFGGMESVIARIVYILVAAGGLYLVFACKSCGKNTCCTDGSCAKCSAGKVSPMETETKEDSMMM